MLSWFEYYLVGEKNYTKIEGSYMDIETAVQNNFSSLFDSKTFLNCEDSPAYIQASLKQDAHRVMCISDDKDFLSQCFDYEHQLIDTKIHGSYTQGSFTGEIFSNILFMHLYSEAVESGDMFKKKQFAFIYQGTNEDKGGFGVSAYFLHTNVGTSLAFTFVNDFKKPCKDKSGVLIVIKGPINKQASDKLKGEIENNIHSNVIKDWLILELFNSDGTFNIGGINNVKNVFEGRNIINNSVIQDRILEIRNAQTSNVSDAGDFSQRTLESKEEKVDPVIQTRDVVHSRDYATRVLSISRRHLSSIFAARAFGYLPSAVSTFGNACSQALNSFSEGVVNLWSSWTSAPLALEDSKTSTQIASNNVVASIDPDHPEVEPQGLEDSKTSTQIAGVGESNVVASIDPDPEVEPQDFVIL
jgi:hypothetical protein